MKHSLLILIALCCTSSLLPGQEKATIKGTVRDSLGQAVELANVALLGSQEGTMTNHLGQFEMELPAGEELTIVVSCVGYVNQEIRIVLETGQELIKRIVLETDVQNLREVSVTARQERASTFQRIDVEDLNYMPSTTGKVEAIIKSQAGVSSNNELSSQYSVRGGNFDENLVYVNDIEIYRPFLVRSGQQEGLSFVNSDLVSSVKFSAGGYDARYGDRMSSALDISYRRPRKFAGTSSISLLGASAHVEGLSKDGRFTYLAGYRYKTTSYLLNSLETEGDYKPQFSDFQSMLTYRFNKKWEISFLGNYGSNRYEFIPSETDVEFGTKDLPLNLKIYYEGQEVDRFDTYLGALCLKFQPMEDVSLKLMASAFRTSEEETFDILGQYLINELDNTINSDTYGDSILNVGVGAFLNHARNYLDATVISISHLGSIDRDERKVQWGIKYQKQFFYDHISEWELIDSSGYVIPYDGEQIILTDARNGKNEISYDQFSAFIQSTWEIPEEKADFFLTAGLRGSVWNFNQTSMLSPRVTLSMQPHWDHDMMFHISGGYYYQPPFYKEMRLPDGSINEEVEPQRSIHLLLGGDYIFSMFDRPFKLTGEMYYKWLSNLIPYKIENVRTMYAGENISSGYARGIDFKLNGEFVPGAESWMTLSLLQTREDIEGDHTYIWDQEEQQYFQTEAGMFPRPTDQLFSAGMFFQDYLPNNPLYKVHLNAFFGTGLPLSNPRENEYYSTRRMRSYKRVDIGFSRVLNIRFFKSLWLSGEIFNLLGIKNEASYLWIKTISDQEGVPAQFAVPNYLTGRRFNLKISVKF